MHNTVFNFTLPTKLYEKLRIKANEKNISIAALVRIICSEYIAKED